MRQKAQQSTNLKHFMMDNKGQEMFVVQADLDREVYTLKQSLNTANDALQKLQKNVDLSFLPEPVGITTEWLHFYISGRTEAISKNLIFDAATSDRLIAGWKKIEEQVKPDVKAVEKFCKKFTDQISYDEESGQMVFNDVEQLAIGRVEKPLPEDCNTHIEMIDCIRNMVLQLRQWEKAHRVKKNTLQSLLQADTENIKSMWTQGAILINDANEEPRDRWLRLASEQQIF